MTGMPNAPEVTSPRSVKWTTRFGARAVLAAVALALVAVPGALILLLVEDKWAPLLRADDGARDRLHNFAVTHTGFVGAMQLISDSGSPLAWQIVLGVVVIWLLWAPAAPSGLVRGDHRGRFIAAERRCQDVRPSIAPGPDPPGRP